MFYYKITATIADEKEAKLLDDMRKGLEERRKCSRVSFECLENTGNKQYFFVSSTTHKSILMGFISAENKKIDEGIKAGIKKLNFDVFDIEYSETTLLYICRMLDDAENMGFVERANEALGAFGIESLYDRGYRPNRFEFEEYVLQEEDIQAVADSTKCFMAKESLDAELKRIKTGTGKKKASGHPVHYLLQTDDIHDGEEIAKVLMSNLFENKRIESKRYTLMKFRHDTSCMRWELASIYNNSKGGTVLVCLCFPNEGQSEFASPGLANLEKLCTMLKEYSNSVLTIFWAPKANENVKKHLYEELGYTNLVEIYDEAADSVKAREYLKNLAHEKKVRTDKKLFEKVEDGKSYISTELDDIYDMWYSNKLKTVIYPQYKDICAVKSKVIEDGPRGCAYDELMEMIGLEKAKSVIKQALDYNKAQKLFADKGVKFDRTSMHMVFTGNPGTAKTSVARLFAQIMKDNGILKRGKLIECGRADLVGRFVGWTAPIVKNKFKEASGSVLFIDEAYSLVEDKAGLYGDEAINTIVQEMENHRDDVIVIFAGYPDKMEEFLQRNPGLRSRIAYHVPFDDYNVDELCSIADLIAKNKGMILADDAKDKLREIFGIALKESDFGNGRYVRNVLEKAKMAQASRLVAMDYGSVSSEDIKTIVASDIEMPAGKKKITKIGFCA